MSLGSVRYHITEDVLAQSVGDGAVLFHPETERILTLNACGTRVWQLLSEQPHAAQIIDHLMEEFDGPEDLIRADVLDFLSQLESEQLICRGN